MKNIGVIIQTYNEFHQIEECIRSAQLLTDTISVIDTKSTDNTADKARDLGVSVLSFPFSRYVEPARKFGIINCNAEWVFILDADERITKELAQEIKEAVTTTKHTHFRVPRTNLFAGSFALKHGGWAPDYQLRLIQKDAFVDWPARIHATPEITGSEGRLQQKLLHYFHGDIEKMVQKTAVFEDIESDLLFKADKPVQTSTFFRKFFGELYRRLGKGQAYRDGTVGIIEALYQAFSKTITYLYLYEKKERSTH
ncbi:glycosyltransferase family 2 protein [Candidatus Roizmanbacteria bacterium]|nr:glycosyltransferase family 2 protein [Candidatus Roizmanbacteria bacterium]